MSVTVPISPARSFHDPFINNYFRPKNGKNQIPPRVQQKKEIKQARHGFGPGGSIAKQKESLLQDKHLSQT